MDTGSQGNGKDRDHQAADPQQQLAKTGLIHREGNDAEREDPYHEEHL